MLRGVALAVMALAAGVQTALAQSPVRVVLDTALGEIEIEVDTARAPKTAANFLRYVDEQLYDGGRFHRAVRLDNQVRTDVRIEVVQAGRSPGSLEKHPGFGAIELERTSLTGLRHVDGVVSMARDQPDSAVSDFFICIGDQPALDYAGARNPDGQGFAAFGRAVAGMDVVRKIQALATDDRERIAAPVAIRRAYRKP